MVWNSHLGWRNYLKGILVSLAVGVIASFLGIGGGIIHVPLLSQVLLYPMYLAIGTSHLILAVTAWFATFIHIYNHDIDPLSPLTLKLACGAIVGAQIGARLSSLVPEKRILHVLAICLLAVGGRLLLSFF